MVGLNKKEQNKRLTLQEKKTLAYAKIIKLAENYENNIPTPTVDIAYSYVCNMACSHCMTTKVTVQKNTLTVSTLKNFTDQAHNLGICQLALSGGEPLIFKDLDEVVNALQPEKFHLKMSTNGHFLDRPMAQRLAGLGFDKICISIDEFHANQPQAGHTWQDSQAIRALTWVQENGMDAVMTTVVTRQNCQDGHLERLAEFAIKNDFKLDVYLAKPIGEWAGRYDLLITNTDYVYLQKLNKTYPTLFVDTFSSYGLTRGCNAVRGTIHLSPYGDIFPCGFIHITIGNIFEEPLEHILQRGMQIKHFGERSPICLAGRHIGFLKKISQPTADGRFPPRWDQVFSSEDFLQRG